MWPFFKKRNWEAEMKEFWPCTKTGDDYLDYLAFRSNCPYHILAAFTCVNDSRAYRKELAYWLAIMRASK